MKKKLFRRGHWIILQASSPSEIRGKLSGVQCRIIGIDDPANTYSRHETTHEAENATEVVENLIEPTST